MMGTKVPLSFICILFSAFICPAPVLTDYHQALKGNAFGKDQSVQCEDCVGGSGPGGGSGMVTIAPENPSPPEENPGDEDPSMEETAYVIKWEHIPNDKLFHIYWPQAGVQNGEFLFVCRVLQSNGRYISGKLRVGEGTRCLVANNGGATQHERFEMLISPPDVLNWIEMPEDGSVPHGAIPSGLTDRGKRVYVCRGYVFHHGVERLDIIPGKYAPHHKKCYVVYQGKEYAAKSGGLLVLNAFGLATKTQILATF